MSKKASRRRWRAFGSTFMLTLCLLILGTGFLVAEYNTRRTAFGDARMQMEYRIKDGKVMLSTPSAETEYTLPAWVKDWTGRAWTLLPARIRAAAWFTESEQAASPLLIQWVLDLQRDWAEDYRR